MTASGVAKAPFLRSASSLALSAVLSFFVSQSAFGTELHQPKPQLRCGWFSNPTPGNAWLVDRDAEWVVGIQGGHQAEGDWPEFRNGEWVHFNRSYGYGCACLNVIADRESLEVKRILSAKPRPLEACKKDPALAKRKPEA
jgi:hypothetical protein